MINASEAREDDEDFQNPVDLMFERLEEKDPEHFAVKQYKKYKLAAGKTAKSILISCGARLAPFDIKELRELMETDEMELDTMRLWKASALPQTIRRIFSSTGILLRRTAPLTCRFPLSKAQAWTS